MIRNIATFKGAPFDVDTLVAAYSEYDQSRNKGLGLSESTDAGVLGWSESRFLDSYVKLYEVTGDEAWLDKLVMHTENVLSSMHDHHGDGPTWLTALYPIGVVRCEPLENRGAGCLSPVQGRRWVRGKACDGEYYLEVLARGQYAVFSWPARQLIGRGPIKSGHIIECVPPFGLSLTGLNRVGDRFRILTRGPQPIDHVVLHGQLLYPLGRFCELVSKSRALKASYADITRRIRDLASELIVRHERDWLDVGRGVGAYREPPSDDVPYPNRIMAHNKYLGAARAWIIFASISRKKLFSDRTAAMAKHFRRHLVRTGRAWTWAYWGDLISIIPEDTDHAQVDVGFAVEACRRGVVFRPADMRRFARTLLDQMWNGSLKDPRIGERVDRHEGDVVRFGGWIDLSEWEPEVFDVLWAVFDRDGRQGAHAPAILQGWLRRAKA